MRLNSVKSHIGTILRVMLSLTITIAFAVYQRLTGPTYPVGDELTWQGVNIEYRFNRSHGGPGNQPVEIRISDPEVSGYLVFRRYKTGDPWTGMKMYPEGDELVAELPHQPPAGKLEYFVMLSKGSASRAVPQEVTVVTRFKGDVPDYVLIPHVIMMFLAMVLSVLAAIESFARKPERAYRIAIAATVCLGIGGLILGPVVQKFAFDAFWTGVPWGYDLTDNKTLIAFIAWLIALWRGRRITNRKYWILFGTIVLLAVYTIPHSTMGSELNYNTMQVETGD